MKFKYETPQLIMRVCGPSETRTVYKFYKRNLNDFARYEPIDLKAGKTLAYYKNILEIEKDMFLSQECYRYYLFEKENPFDIVGTLSFRDICYAPYLRSARIGYKVDRDFRRRGYAREAIYTACQALFYEEKIHRIDATVLPDNEASIRLLEGLGFVREGLLRDSLLLGGKWRDHYLYSLIRNC